MASTRGDQRRLGAPQTHRMLMLPPIALSIYSVVASMKALDGGGIANPLRQEQDGPPLAERRNRMHSHLDTFKVDVANSLKMLLHAASEIEDVWDRAVNGTAEAARCQRYGFAYDGRTKRRRIFYGSLIADDSWHTISIAAMEAYGIFDTVALVESNTTQALYPRELRFSPGSNQTQLLQSGMWGPETRVSVDYYYDDPFFNKRGKTKPDELEREMLQRDMILARWRENGMTVDDIGLIADVDEVATRDFVRAVQVCDVPEFRRGQDCKFSKLIASTLVFEGSPGCIQDKRRWYHPDFILGECVEGIGDPLKHRPHNRNGPHNKTFKYGVYMRESEWEGTNRTMFPLWSATDFRMGGGGRMVSGKENLHTAFHMHNFFDSLDGLRRKYKTYGHPVPGALEKQMALIHEGDVGFMVDCLMNRTEEENEWKRAPGGWKSLRTDEMLIAFQRAPAYADMRHRELQHMMVEDEKLHPRDPDLEHKKD